MRNSKKITTAFLYRWTEKSTGMWYEGSRTASGCHPDDGYLTSSKIVKKLIRANPSDWVREIMVLGDPSYIRDLEHRRLVNLDARNDPMSYNQHNGDGKFTTAGRPPWNKGKGKKYLPKDTTPKVVWNKGLTKDDPRVAKYVSVQNKLVSEGKHVFSKLKGVPKSEDHKQKQRKPKHAGHGPAVSRARRGVPLPKIVCRISDRRVMDIRNFKKWMKNNPI